MNGVQVLLFCKKAYVVDRDEPRRRRQHHADAAMYADAASHDLPATYEAARSAPSTGRSVTR